MNPNFSISLSAQVVASAVVAVGQLLVSTGALYVPATLANRTLYGRCEAVALTPYGGNAAVGFIQVQQAGMADVTVSLLPPSVAGYVRASDASGLMERFNPVNGGPSDVVGYAEASGRVHLFFSTKTESEAYLAINGVPAGALPSGVSTELQFRSSASAFGAATNALYSGGGIVINNAGFASFGSPAAASGNARFTNAGTIKWRNASNTADRTVLTFDSGDVLRLGDGTGAQVMQYSSSWGVYNGAAYDLLIGSGVAAFGATAVSFGTTPATSGDIRVQYPGGGTRNIVVVRNSTATDTPILRAGPGDACTVGNGSLDFNLAGITLTGSFTSGGFYASGGKAYFFSNGTNLWVGCSDSSGAANHGITTIGASSAVEFAAPLRGVVTGAANQTLRGGKATIAGAPTSVTASQAQYVNPILNVTTGTAAASFKLIMPLVADSEWTIVNASIFTINVGGVTGITASIAPGAASKVICWNGVDFLKIA